MSSKPPQHQSIPSSLLSDQRGDKSGRHAHFINAAVAVAAADALTKRNVQAYPTPDPTCAASSSCTASASPIQFRSYTVAPSPPVLAPAPRTSAASLATLAQEPAENRSRAAQSPERPAYTSPASRNNLAYTSPSTSTPKPEPHAPSLQTLDPAHGFATPSKSIKRPARTLHHKSSAQSLRPVSRTPSLKTSGFYGPFGSASAASSTVASPIITAMGDVTPLPSPLMASDSPGPWKQLGRRTSRDAPPVHPTPTQNESPTSTAPTKGMRKGYGGLTSWPTLADGPNENQDDRLARPPTHTRSRSISDYIPDPMLMPKRMSTVSGTRVKADLKTPVDAHMRREPHLSEARGLTPVEKPPTPPPSESSLSVADSSSAVGSGSGVGSKQPRAEYFEAYGRYDGKRRRWRAIRMLGQGTFSRVILATSQISSSPSDEEDCSPGTSLPTPEPAPRQDRRSLVAVKICEHGPRGGASEDRIEMSLKRELEMMQDIRHPSLVHLKAWNIEPTRAILVLSYYPGGDLFEVATGHREVLTPPLIRRIFAELVGAVTYLHDKKIVHRDIKLENVLVNLPPAELASASQDWTAYPHSVITLTDLGLSRRVQPADEKLETRCGSDDYAAPEVIMGQPYDGRATDAWSLGVLLYALLEARLPFDPPPCALGAGDSAMHMRMRSRTSHRIARAEWRWYAYGVREEDGGEGEGDHEADVVRFEREGLVGAMEVVEGLLKRARSRWPLAKVRGTEWVAGGIVVEGGIRDREEEEGEEVL
ncbi:kinase-like protein [Trichocladium antarcticum]|uniref:Kinase-like protein n=1 Tax=Trichocladium antarcticum TaxID=1450529 RepID=A0AAN6UTB6_9PEZI|nr:kinase-like protein [Trichocladium antarcticum]